MDALQAGCHVFIEKPLSTSVQEAVDIVNVARGRNRLVGVGHQYRLCPSLAEARRRLQDGVLGPIRLVTATLAQPWLAAHSGADQRSENAWRFDPRVAGGLGGILADAGDHLLDALLWITGQTAVEAAAIQSRDPRGLDLVTAAVVRLADGTPATLAVTGVTPGSRFELSFYGETGKLHVTDQTLDEQRGQAQAGNGHDEGEADPFASASARPPGPASGGESIDANFVASIVAGTPLCCPADQALDTVRLLEALSRSAATGQLVRLH